MLIAQKVKGAELAWLRSRGLIRQAVLFLTPENSDAAVEAMISG